MLSEVSSIERHFEEGKLFSPKCLSIEDSSFSIKQYHPTHKSY